MMSKARKIGPPHRGLWVYKPTWIGNETSLRAFETHLAKNDINEVYLSSNLATLGSEELGGFIGRMSRRCVTVEALTGKPEWATKAGRADMISQIDRVIAYNAAHGEDEKFSAVHLDVEPWIGTGESMAWLPGLLEAYAVAKAHLGALALTVDVAGSKIQKATPAQRRSLAETAEAIVLMQYETALAPAVARTQKFADGVSFGDAVFLLALRSADFPVVRETMTEAQLALHTMPGYGGWAIFDGQRTF